MRGLALDVLSCSLGLDRSEVAARLDHGIAGNDIPADMADRLRAVLDAAGCPAVSGRDAAAAVTDLSVQLAVWADPARVARRLASCLGRDEADIAADLARPGGMVLGGLSSAELTQMEALIGPVRGTVLTASDPATALYDVFASRPAGAASDDRLSPFLRLLGAAEDPLTGAIAANLSQRQCRYLMARLPDLGLLPLDQSFQRFDLRLTGTTGWVTRDLADFLAARTQQPRARFETLLPEAPVTLDLGLTRTVARQFCADYAAIGLFVRPVLSGRVGNP